MSGRASWSGSLTFAGFPFPLRAYNLTPSTKNESFKTLCECHGEPIKQQNTCATTGTALAADKQRKGVEVAKGAYHTLDATTVENINGVGKTTTLEVERVCPVTTLELHALTGGFVIVPEPKAGAEKPVAILWRTLTKAKLAIVTRWTPRAGSRDSILAIYPGAKGLLAATLPFEHQRTNVPEFAACDIAVADAELAMFEQALTTLYPNGDYQPADFVSEYSARRAKAVEAAIAGQPVPATAAPAAPVVPDLMAALSASLAAVKEPPNDKEVVTA